MLPPLSFTRDLYYISTFYQEPHLLPRSVHSASAGGRACENCLREVPAAGGAHRARPWPLGHSSLQREQPLASTTLSSTLPVRSQGACTGLQAAVCPGRRGKPEAPLPGRLCCQPSVASMGGLPLGLPLLSWPRPQHSWPRRPAPEQQQQPPHVAKVTDGVGSLH